MCYKSKFQNMNLDPMHDEDELIALRKTFYRVMDIREIFMKALMYLGMLNIVYFSECVLLFFKFNPTNKYIEIKSLTIMGIAALIYVFTFAMFIIEPDPFDYFRYAFKKNKLAMSFYFFYTSAILSTIVLLGLFPTVPWIPLIPFSVLLTFTVLYRPYR